MADEGFRNYEVDELTQGAIAKQREHLARSIGRWRCCDGTDNYLKPKMFDRWRRFVKMRKLVGYWLDNMHNRQKVRSANLSDAFLKWKFFFGEKERALQRLTLD